MAQPLPNVNIKPIQIEIPALLVFFAILLSEAVTANLIIFRTCYVTLGYNKTECALLGTSYSDNATEQLEKSVQPFASVISMTLTLLTSISTMVLCLFVGPWSDRFGRKPILVVPALGFAFGYMILMVFSLLPHLSPWYVLIAAIPQVLSGGVSCFLTVMFSYITDVTSKSNRSFKMGIFMAVINTGVFLGCFLSFYTFNALNYDGVYLMSCCSCLLAVIYTIFFVAESLPHPAKKGGLKEVFEVSHLADILACVFKKRKNSVRCIIISCVVVIGLYMLSTTGEANVIFLYLRGKFNFSLQSFALYNAAFNLAWVTGTVVGVYGLHNLLKVPETVLVVVAIVSLFSGSLIQGFADRKWKIYAAAFVRSPAGVLTAMLRSLVSKSVPSNDVGKIYVVLITSESLFAIFASPFYTTIYNKTLNVNSAIFSFVSAGIYGLILIVAVFGIVMQNTKTNLQYNELNTSESEMSEIDELEIIS